MKLKRKLKSKLINEILHNKTNRNEQMNFILQYLGNVGERYSVTHFLNDQYKANKITKSEIETQIGFYINSLVTCWETYFRDTFIFVCDCDENIGDLLKSVLIEKNISEQDIIDSGCSVSEFFSKQYNFQDIDDTCRAFNFIYNESKTTIAHFLDDDIFNNLIFSSANYLMHIKQEMKDEFNSELYSVLKFGFEERHKIVHDANYNFELNPENIVKIEDSFIVFPQMFSSQISQVYDFQYVYKDIETGHIGLAKKSDSESNMKYYWIMARKDFVADYNPVEE